MIVGKFNVSFPTLTINQQFGTNTFLINCSFGVENGRNARVESQGFCWSTKNQKPTTRDFGWKNGINKPSNQVFEFMKDTQTWKEQTPIPLDINQNYQTWFATDSSCTFLSYSTTGNGYRPSFWEYKPAKSGFVKLPEIIEFASLDITKSVQFGDKIIFISKDYLAENFSIYSFDPRTNIIKKLTTTDQFCGNYTSIQNLWINENTLYFHIERIEPQIATGLAVFGAPLGRFDLQTNQLKPFVDIQKIYEGIKIEYPPYIHYFSDGQRTFALNLSIFLPFQIVIND